MKRLYQSYRKGLSEVLKDINTRKKDESSILNFNKSLKRNRTDFGKSQIETNQNKFDSRRNRSRTNRPSDSLYSFRRRERTLSNSN